MFQLPTQSHSSISSVRRTVRNSSISPKGGAKEINYGGAFLRLKPDELEAVTNQGTPSHPSFPFWLVAFCGFAPTAKSPLTTPTQTVKPPPEFSYSMFFTLPVVLSRDTLAYPPPPSSPQGRGHENTP